MTSATPSRVLAVDGEGTLANMIAAILEPLGFEVQTAYSGSEALSAARDFFPHFVVSDFSMPSGMMGCKPVSRSRTSFRAVVHVTARNVESQSAIRSVQAGADALLALPLTLADFVHRARETLQVHRLQQRA
jgi:DNA-binding response OmpR family regulator